MEILDSAIKAFEKMVEDDKSGVKPMYRSRDWNAEERQKSKLNKNSTGGIQPGQKFSTRVFCLSHPPLGVSWQRNCEKGKKN